MNVVDLLKDINNHFSTNYRRFDEMYTAIEWLEKQEATEKEIVDLKEQIDDLEQEKADLQAQLEAVEAERDNLQALL